MNLKVLNLKSMDNYGKILIFMILISLLIKLIMIDQGMNILLSKFLEDDAFYYYSLVLNIINGQGIVFNLGIPTNGFHPIYALILIPVFYFTHSFGDYVPVYISLVILSLFNVLTSIFLYLIVKNLFNKEAGLLTAFIWLFNPEIMFITLKGMEVPIQIFFISILTYYLIKLNLNELNIRNSVIIGFLLGIIFLSRMDGFFLTLGVILALSIRFIKNRSIDYSWQSNKIKSMVAILISAFITVLPWILYNILIVKQLLPVSLAAKNIIRSDQALHVGLYNNILTTFYPSLVLLTQYFFFFIQKNVFNLAILLLILIIFLLPPFYLVLKKDNPFIKVIKSLDFLIFSIIIFYLFYFFYGIMFREYYYLYTYFIFTIFLSIALIRLFQIFKIKKVKLRYALIILLLIFTFILGGINRYDYGNLNPITFEVINYIDTNISPDQNIGNFNSGLLNYGTGRDFINLDGMMNPEAYNARKAGMLEDYIMKKRIKYIIDMPSSIKGINNDKISLQYIKTFKGQKYGEDLVLYKLNY
ncbi:MAG: glycosyltransferase family 39 protein [Methanobacterium sp.]|uniref:glycosyltransferase family 39 protein n=1 Tax=Methanobacterium sp. TaxID=2164 RepID=UPI003D64773E|nr:glycosyltransferase family 39 protein [Methanobacterium sp.]